MKYRPHLRGVAESMAKAREFTTVDEFRAIITEMHPEIFTGKSSVILTLTPYGSDVETEGLYTFTVTADGTLIGFTNGEPIRPPNKEPIEMFMYTEWK